MSSFMMSNESLSRIAKALDAVFTAHNFSQYGSPLYTGKLESFFNDCCHKDKTYDLAKITSKLFDMNKQALEECYKQSASDMYSDCLFDKSVPDDIRLFNQAKTQNIENFYAKLIPLYKILSCYLYQCAEGKVYESELYVEMRKFKERVADLIIENLPGYDDIPWG